MAISLSKLPVITGIPSKVVFKIGPPCSGKGAEGRALYHLHHKRRYLGTITMRQLLKSKSDRDPNFKRLCQTKEAEGLLVPNEHIAKVLGEMKDHHRLPKKVFFFDGLPRDPEQVHIIARMFERCTIMISENEAPTDHLINVFTATRDSSDRTGRLDAESEEVFLKRVALYQENLPKIKDAISGYGWKHHTCDATLPLHERVSLVQSFVGLQHVSPSKLINLESALGLTPLRLKKAA